MANTYSDEDKQKIMAEVCDRIAEGEYLDVICRDDHMPAVRTIRKWINKNPEFERGYFNAYSARSYSLLDEMERLQDPEHNPINVLQNGAWDSAHVTYVRDRVTNLQWRLQKLLPRRFGDLLKIAGDDDQAPIRITDQEAAHKIEAILATAKARREDAKTGDGS